ncbi:hypothetical protein BDF22DRAFT_685449 [Syncephalis plumigaleata]|nr:hypothetical protein BDF22DRAFT_685449 [Syncephalis plumigaleata]
MSRRGRSPSPNSRKSTTFSVIGMKDGSHSDDGGRGRRNRNRGSTAVQDRKQNILSRIGGSSTGSPNTHRAGGIHKKTTRRVGTDRDGDLSMNGPARGAPYARPGKGNNRVKEDIKGVLGSSRSNQPMSIIIKNVQGDNHTSLIDYLSKQCGSPLSVANIQRRGKHIIVNVPNRTQALALIGLSGTKFSGQNLVIEKASDKGISEIVNAAVDTIDTLRTFLRPRYTQATKFLNLESMHQDPILTAKGIDCIGTASKSSHTGPALMKLIKEMFPDVVSISLADNRLVSCHAISTICQYLPELQNLSLQNNLLPNYKSLEQLKGPHKLKKLRELILIGNPVREEAIAHAGNDIIYRSEIVSRFPQITMLDQRPVESNLKEIASAVVDATLPLSINPAFFDNDATRETATAFLARFLAAFDQNRALLYDVYDDNAVMSLAINMSSLPVGIRGSGSRNVNWNSYIKSSRNLVRLEKQHRRNEVFVRGHTSIIECITRLPRTVHDQSDANKYVVDAIQHMGIYPAQPSAIVMSILVHGEFTEDDKTIRSFDRHFLVAPALPESRHAKAGWPCVILSDMWTIRLHSDGSAWQPKPVLANPTTPVPNEQQRNMINELRQRTGLNEQFATLCLTEMEWSFERALTAFEQAKVFINSSEHTRTTKKRRMINNELFYIINIGNQQSST